MDKELLVFVSALVVSLIFLLAAGQSCNNAENAHRLKAIELGCGYVNGGLVCPSKGFKSE